MSTGDGGRGTGDGDGRRGTGDGGQGQVSGHSLPFYLLITGFNHLCRLDIFASGMIVTAKKPKN